MSNDNKPELSLGYLLGKIDQLTSDTAYLHEAIAALQGVTQTTDPGDMNSPGDIAGKAKAQALGSAIMSRETTNQQLIALYRQMYEDMRSPSSNKLDQLRQVTEIFKNASSPSLPFVQEIAEKMLGLPADEEDD